MAGHRMCQAMARKKIKLEGEAISAILVAHTDSNHKLQQVADYQLVDRLKKGLQIFILFFQSTKRCEKSEVPHINKESSPTSLLMFFTEIFYLMVE